MGLREDPKKCCLAENYTPCSSQTSLWLHNCHNHTNKNYGVATNLSSEIVESLIVTAMIGHDKFINQISRVYHDMV